MRNNCPVASQTSVWCAERKKKKCSHLFSYKAIFVWFSHFIMSRSTLGYFEQNRWPGTGSSSKTAGSQSVKGNYLMN